MDWREAQVDPGASVEAADGPLGTVEDVVISPRTGELSHLVARRGSTTERVMIPAAAIAEIPSRRTVRLRVGRDELESMASGTRAEARGENQIRVPILEERLEVGTRPVELGEVRLRKSIELFEQVARQPVMREDVVVERVPMSRELDVPAEPHMDGDWFVVPVMEEMLVVQKRLVLKEEIRIKKRQVTEEYEVREQLRRERVEVEDATTHGIAGQEAGALPRAIADPDVTGRGPADGEGAGTAASSPATTGGTGAERH